MAESGSNLASLPELLEIIGAYLTPLEIVRCSFTCRLWYQTLIPLAWRVFDDSCYQWPKIMSTIHSDSEACQQNTAWLKTLFFKYGSHIRILRAQWRSTISIAYESGLCTRLVALESFDFNKDRTARSLRIDHNSMDDSPEMWITLAPREVTDALWAKTKPWTLSVQQKIACETTMLFWVLIHLNSSTLCTLSLDQSLNCVNGYSEPLLDAIILRLQNLQELSNSMYTSNLDTLLHRLPTISSIHGSFNWDITKTTCFDNLRVFSPTKSLSLSDVHLILKRCPKLNCLSLESLDTTISQQELSSILEEHYPTFQLQEIRFMDPRERLINTLAVRFLLKPLAHLRHITLYRLHEYIVNTLVTCCENLESFRQINDELTYNPLLDTDNTLLYLLQGCPKLRVIDAIQHRIDAQALVESPPWVCHNLEVFRTQIIGVFRLEESGRSILHQLLSTEMLLGNLFLTEQEKHAMKMNRETLVQQQQVHARLSVLTRLKVLEIGVRRSKFNYYTGQMDTYSDTLEWTLRSGLDQLSPLKELEVIGFDGCNHETDRQEIDWMVANWPRLRAIRGLQSTCPWVLLTEQRKTNLRTYIQQIKPGIELLNSTQN